MQHAPRARLSFSSASPALLLLWVTLLTGCGFQPRGQSPQIAALPGPVYLSGVQPYSALHRELSAQMQEAGAVLAADAASAAATLHISRQRSDTRVLSVDSRNKAVEYELEESVSFALRTADGREPAARQTVRVVRILFQPQDAVLGGNREAELLRGDMHRELAGRIVRRLAASP